MSVYIEPAVHFLIHSLPIPVLGVINTRVRTKKLVICGGDCQKFSLYNNLTGESLSFSTCSRDAAWKMNIFAAWEASQELGGSFVWRNGTMEHFHCLVCEVATCTMYIL